MPVKNVTPAFMSLLTSSAGELYTPTVVIATPKRTVVRKRKARQPRKQKAAPRRRAKTSGPFRTIGKWLGGAVDRFVGTGDYSIERNTVLRPGTVPAMHSSSTTTLVRHREYIADVVSNTGTAPTITTYTLNPGLTATFPWLASVAQCYEMYRILGCVFEYRTLSGDVTTASNQGYICSAVNYNPTGSPFTTKSAIENAMGGQSKKPSEDMFIPVECKPVLNPLGEYFVRDSPLTSSQNANFYDLGVVTIAVGGNPTGGVVLGELWVTYEVELAKPAMDLVTNDVDGARLMSPTGTASATPWGVTDSNVYSFNTLGAYTSAVSNKLIIPPNNYKYYYIHIDWQGTVATNVYYPSRTFTNATLVSAAFAAGIQYPTVTAGVLTTGCGISMVVMVTDMAQPVELLLGSGGVLPAGTLTTDVTIMACPPPRPALSTDRKALDPPPSPPPSTSSLDGGVRDIEECDEDLYSAIRVRVAEVAERKRQKLAL